MSLYQDVGVPVCQVFSVQVCPHVCINVYQDAKMPEHQLSTICLLLLLLNQPWQIASLLVDMYYAFMFECLYLRLKIISDAVWQNMINATMPDISTCQDASTFPQYQNVCMQGCKNACMFVCKMPEHFYVRMSGFIMSVCLHVCMPVYHDTIMSVGQNVSRPIHLFCQDVRIQYTILGVSCLYVRIQHISI